MTEKADLETWLLTQYFLSKRLWIMNNKDQLSLDHNIIVSLGPCN